jgi:signal transduction histidine kinase
VLRRIPVRTRIVAALALGSVAISALIAVATWNLSTGYMLQQREASVLRQATVNSRLVEDAVITDPNGLGTLLTGLAASPQAAIFVRYGGRWRTGGTQADNLGPDDVPPALLAASARGEAARQRVRITGSPEIVVALPLTRAHADYVEVFPLRELDRTFRFVSLMLLAGVLASGLLGASLGIWASRRALRPLTDLTAIAGRVARGDLGARMPVRDEDPDLRPIAAAFNETARTLQARAARDARFASDVSHELRSPVTTMVTAMEVLSRRREEMSPAARNAVDLLDTDLHRFRRLVEDLLEISRVDQGAVTLSAETLDLTALVRNVAARIRPEVAVEADGPRPVRADRRRLERVVENLAENAERHGRGLVRVGVCARPGVARLEVDDAGPGVPAEDRGRVFERFARVARRDRHLDDAGTGLGLALAEQHVSLHGGRIWVEDRPGGGARFVVELPESR